MKIPTRIAFIGCGAVVEKLHAPAIEALSARHPIEVVGAFDVDADRRAALTARFPGCQAVDSVERIPTHTAIAIVASPPDFHAAQTITLLNRGINVLCEKPMAMTHAECEAMTAAARGAGQLLSVGHVRRFFPVSQQVRRLVQERPLGRALSFRIVAGQKYEWAAKSDGHFRRASGGGVLPGVGVHFLDLLLWWFGEPVRVKYEDDAMGGVEANARVSLGYADGLEGEVVLSWDWNMREYCFVQFENGWVSFNPTSANRLHVSLSRGTVLDSAVHEETNSGGWPEIGRPGATFQQAFIEQMINMVDAVTKGAPLVTPGEDAAQSIRLIEQCYRVRKLIAMPWLTDQERSAAESLS